MSFLCKMRKKLQFAGRYFKYWLYAKHNTKSAFVNSIIKEILQSNQKFYSFKEIESVNTSGAGDAFLAGVISGLSNENPLKKGHESAIRALMSETSYIKVDK